MDTITAEQHASRLRSVGDLPCPRGLPWFGNALQLESTRFHLKMEQWARELGPFYRFRVGRREVVVVADATLIGSMLRDRPDAMRRPAHTSRILSELGTDGVFVAEGEEWRKQRKLVMRALTPEVVKNFFPTLVMLTERLRLRWQAAAEQGRTIDLLRDLKAWTMDVTIALAMGQDINTLEHAANSLQRDVDAVFKRIGSRLTKPLAYWRHVKLPADRAADASADRIARAVSGFIAEARTRLAASPELPPKPSNLLEALVVARDEPGSEFTDTNVAGNAVTMVFAGEDTTSNTIAWLLDFLAREPQAAARLAAEADTVIGDDERVLQHFAALDDFSYLDAATSEAMRLKPVAPILGLEPNQDMVIGDVRLHKGQMVMALLRESGRLSSAFPDLDAFRPERWLEAGALPKKDDPARKLFPFGGGQRFCPGRYLALAEIKMVVSMIARNFELSPRPGAAPAEESFSFTMNPSGLPVRLAPRRTTAA